ncbi:MAG: hypothetical protein N2C12_00220 [Planctomycetales bacterium]
MDIDIAGIVLRWMHIFAAIALFGGLIYQRVALIPAAQRLEEEPRKQLSEAVRRPWSRVVMVAILFLVISGFVNFARTSAAFKAVDLKLPPLYHMLWGTKVILALAIFFLASALAGRGTATQRFRDQAAKWLTVSILLAVLVVAISGVLRSIHTAPNALINQPQTTASMGH